MDIEIKEEFLSRWRKYFGSADLPIVFFYTDEPGPIEQAPPAKSHHCLICDLARVRAGQSLALDVKAIPCSGGQRYLGFTQSLMPDFEYFLSCGIPGKIEGERYIRTPELVAQRMKHMVPFAAPGKYIVFKRWDKLEAGDRPLAVIFFAVPDVLAGLFTLANFDEAENAVVAPFGAGCGTIVNFPWWELHTPRPKAVLGMFDVSARPCVPAGVLTFSVPWPKFERMVATMDESFLITPSWEKVRARLGLS